MDEQTKTDLAVFLRYKKSGGAPLAVGVSRGVWMGGIHEEVEHEPFVFVGPDGWEGEEELTFLPTREAVESLIERLRIAAREAWG